MKYIELIVNCKEGFFDWVKYHIKHLILIKNPLLKDVQINREEIAQQLTCELLENQDKISKILNYKIRIRDDVNGII